MQSFRGATGDSHNQVISWSFVLFKLLLNLFLILWSVSTVRRTDTSGHGRHMLSRVFVRDTRGTNVAIRSSDVYSLPDWWTFQPVLCVWSWRLFSIKSPRTVIQVWQYVCLCVLVSCNILCVRKLALYNSMSFIHYTVISCTVLSRLFILLILAHSALHLSAVGKWMPAVTKAKAGVTLS